jgi:hypothetical protein
MIGYSIRLPADFSDNTTTLVILDFFFCWFRFSLRREQLPLLPEPRVSIPEHGLSII